MGLPWKVCWYLCVHSCVHCLGSELLCCRSCAESQLSAWEAWGQEHQSQKCHLNREDLEKLPRGQFPSTTVSYSEYLKLTCLLYPEDRTGSGTGDKVSYVMRVVVDYSYREQGTMSSGWPITSDRVGTPGIGPEEL